MTVEGTAYVFYQETGSWDLKHASRTSSGWAVETLDGNSTVGGRTTHAVGAGVSARANGYADHRHVHRQHERRRAAGSP